MEVLDSASGERIYAVVGARRTFATQHKSSEIGSDEVRDAVTAFSKQWRTRLERGRGVTTG